MSAGVAQPRAAGRGDAGRRAGYVASVLVNGLILFLTNEHPGWQTLPFLTPAFADVLPLINASIVANLVANAVFVVYDGRRLKALLQLVLAGFSLAVSVQLLSVFPFDFGTGGFPWAGVLRVLLVIGVIGSAIAIVVSLVTALVPARSAGWRSLRSEELPKDER